MRIVLIQPCCIGDVVLATAALMALRRGYPDAHITWAVGSWSKAAVEGHPLLDAVLDTGSAALPVATPGGLLQFVAQLRQGNFDLAVSLVRSPRMSLALLLSGIDQRAGLDSAGRGFGYNIRVPLDPLLVRSEGDIYLDVVRALGIDVSDCRANLPVLPADAESVRELLAAQGIEGRYLVLNPAGGRNPGMTLDIKRYPPAQMAALANRLAAHFDARVVLVGAAEDRPLLDSVASGLNQPPVMFAGVLTFGQIGALARGGWVYVGNDTGLTHLAAAAGARTVAIFGPSDPARYAPFVTDALVLWQPTALHRGGVAAGAPADWDWARDGIGVDEAAARVIAWLG
jgi:ADP-heptose:LPS heptosyltransferase